MKTADLLKRLVCIRLTDEIYAGKLKAVRYIKDRRSSLTLPFPQDDPGSRFTVHFSLNYPYEMYDSRGFGVFRWDHKKTAVLIPLESLLRSGQNPLNIHSADTFFLREVTLPDDAVVLEQPDLIQKVKDETERMGFEVRSGNIRGWRYQSVIEQRKTRREFQRIAKELGVTSTYHIRTIFGRFESCVSIVKDYWSCFDHWQSNEPKVVRYYRDLQNNLRERANELKELIPKLPDDAMKKYALHVLKSAGFK